MPMLTAAQNVELPLLLTKLGSSRRRAQVAAVLDIVGLSDRAKHYPRSFRVASNSAWLSLGP
jgi:putative ABC transport system ATP-binding protein